MEEDERPVKVTDICLLQSKIQFPQKAVFQCKMCPARSDDVADLGKLCGAPR